MNTNGNSIPKIPTVYYEPIDPHGVTLVPPSGKPEDLVCPQSIPNCPRCRRNLDFYLYYYEGKGTMPT